MVSSTTTQLRQRITDLPIEVEYVEDGRVETVVEANATRIVADWLARTSPEKIAATRHEVDLFYRRHGITFGAYGAVDGHETTIPFDIIPRVIAWDEWEYLHKGLVQRVRALNAFLLDLYGKQQVIRDGVVPADVPPYTMLGFLFDATPEQQRTQRQAPEEGGDDGQHAGGVRCVPQG